MKPLTRIVHRLVRFLRLEGLLIYLGAAVPFLRKAIPLPSEYEPHKYVIVERDDTKFKIDRSDYMQWYLYTDQPDLSWKMAASYLANHCVVLDIGANCGHFSLKLANTLIKKGNSDFSIHAFEPNPEVYRQLRLNNELNTEISTKVSCYPLALGDISGEVPFAFNRVNTGGGSITSKKMESENLIVEIDRLDQVAVTLALTRIDFIKVDVEGHEPEVILGGLQTIKRFKPWLYLEMTDSWFQLRHHSVNEITELLMDMRYQLMGEKGNQFIPYVDNKQVFASMKQFNLLAKPLTHGK